MIICLCIFCAQVVPSTIFEYFTFASCNRNYLNGMHMLANLCCVFSTVAFFRLSALGLQLVGELVTMECVVGRGSGMVGVCCGWGRREGAVG